MRAPIVRFTRFLSILWLGVALACAGVPGPDPEVETGSRAEVTADGLHRIRNSKFKREWAKPDSELIRYRAIMLVPPRVSYEHPPLRRRSSFGMKPNFLLSDEQMTILERRLSEVLGAELRKSDHYQIVDEPGPDTLLIVPTIIDLVVLLPTDQADQNGIVVVNSVAVMTLVIGVFDVRTGELLMRMVERRVVQVTGSRGTTTRSWSGSADAASAVRITFRRWARILRERLDGV